MIQLVRSFTERVRQRRRVELALVFLLGLAGAAMSGTGPDPNFCRVQGPSHTATQETTRIVRAIDASARAARRARVVELASSPPHPRVLPLSAPPSSPTPRIDRFARLPGRVRGPPA